MSSQAGPLVHAVRARGHDDEGAMMRNDEASRFRELLAAERRSADLYDGLAEDAHGQRREILNQVAAVERRHAEHWAGKLVELGEPMPAPGSRGSRTRVFSCL